MFVFSGGVFSPPDINGTDEFNLIEYCEDNRISSEEELQGIVSTYYGETRNTDSIEVYSDIVVSFDLTIDYENQYVITTTVYESRTARSATSGYSIKNYRSSSGFIIYKVRVDGSFNYNGTSCSTASATATFTPTPIYGWSSSPNASSGRSGDKAYARAYGTAVNGGASNSYSVYLYCNANGELSSS